MSAVAAVAAKAITTSRLVIGFMLSPHRNVRQCSGAEGALSADEFIVLAAAFAGGRTLRHASVGQCRAPAAERGELLMAVVNPSDLRGAANALAKRCASSRMGWVEGL